MDANEGYIVSQVKVTRQMVTLAKGFFIKTGGHRVSTEGLITSLYSNLEIELVRHINIEPSPELTQTLTQVANIISWRLAAIEAIWGLIHSNLFIPTTHSLIGSDFSIGWTQVGFSSGWNFSYLMIPFPVEIALAPSNRFESFEQPLTDADLFLHQLDIPDLHPEILSTLKEAVKCFRYELYSACLGMLGKASEGAWIELGVALTKVLPQNVDSEKKRKSFISPFIGIAKKMDDIIKLYERQDVFDPVAKLSGVNLQDLRQIYIWSDAVRDARNSLHYGADPVMPNSYEKVAALLVGTISHFKPLYLLKKAAEDYSNQQS